MKDVLLEVLVEPPPVAAMPFTVTAPETGDVTSEVIVNVAVLVRAALFVAVTVCAPEAPTAPDQA